MDERCKALWEKLSAALKPQVSADTFKRWFSAVELIKATDDEVTFLVPNNIYQFWIESNHMAALQSAITIACGEPRTVRFLTASESNGEEIDLTAPENKALQMLVEEVEKRTNIRWQQATNWPASDAPVIVVGLKTGIESLAGAGSDLQPALYLWRSRLRQNASDAGDRSVCLE